MERNQYTIVCPSCQTFFHIDEQVIGPHGRTVRCTSCRKVWFEKPQHKNPISSAKKLMDSQKPLRQIERLAHVPASKRKPLYQPFPEDFLLRRKRRTHYIRFIWFAFFAFLGVITIFALYKYTPTLHLSERQYNVVSPSWTIENSTEGVCVHLQGKVVNMLDSAVSPPTITASLSYSYDGNNTTMPIQMSPFMKSFSPGQLSPFSNKIILPVGTKVQSVIFNAA
ncbi:MAG: zinc-ribbon domain-containing protein [Alphaproteobacteria bacterium]|nr:zinc-ribbon domain-containing protein [Alphaproteobacteria bacterium]